MNWRNALVSPFTAIIDVLKIIDESALQIALVVGDSMKLLGTVTDGDIRRGLLRGVSLQEPVSAVMNGSPIIARITDNRARVADHMAQKHLRHIPVVDNSGRLVNLYMENAVPQDDGKDNWVILMAGGMGTRLRPLTDNCPKPLLTVGGKPLLETIMESFIAHGFRRFYISVNYLAAMIESYFGDGSRWGVEIRYLRENRQLGTAGAIGLIDDIPTRPFFVMNGDILTKVNYSQMLDFHLNHGGAATICVRDHGITIPYGVVEVDGHELRHIREKPTYSFFVNAGIYVLDPSAMRFISRGESADMPSVLDRMIDYHMTTAVFPIREYWIDIGRMDDYTRANEEFKEGFL